MNRVELALVRAARDEVIAAAELHEHAAAHDEVLVVEFTLHSAMIRAVSRARFNASTGNSLRRAVADGGLAAWIVVLAGDVGARFIMTARPLALGGAA